MSLRGACLPSRHELDAGYRYRGEGQGSSDGSLELIAGQRRQGLRAARSSDASDGAHPQCKRGDVSNHFEVYGEYWQDGDPTGNMHGAGNGSIAQRMTPPTTSTPPPP